MNQSILEALFARTSSIGAFPEKIQRDLLNAMGDLRTNHLFPPDYQADFLEEEAGLDYFIALSKVDYDQPNPVHCFVADLVVRGQIAAIVTTNFDQLFEIALSSVGTPFVTAVDEESFNKVESELAAEKIAGVPILKVHGSADRPASMIDTRKQRRRGRARSLTDCLHGLLSRHPLVVAGFSGDDLNDDPEYLGLRAAREVSQGLIWIAHPSLDSAQQPLGRGALKLIDHYGTAKATVVVADATSRLAEWAGAEVPPFDLNRAQQRARERLKERLADWAKGVDICKAVCMAAALCEAAGFRPWAHKQIRAAWNRGIENTEGLPDASRRQFLRAHARVRLRRGRYDDIELGHTIRLLHESNDPLAESIDFFRQIMRHSPGHDLSYVCRITSHFQASKWPQKSDAVDAGLFTAYADTVNDLDLGCIGFLEDCMRIAFEDGDEVRQSLCAIEISVRLAKAGVDRDRSEVLASFATGIGQGIRDARIASGTSLAHAFAHHAAGQAQRAEELFREAFAFAISDELRLHMARAALYWLRLAAAESLNFHAAYSAVNELNDEDLGPLAAWKTLALAEYAIRNGLPEALEVVGEMIDIASLSGLAWYQREAARICNLAVADTS